MWRTQTCACVCPCEVSVFSHYSNEERQIQKNKVLKLGRFMGPSIPPADKGYDIMHILPFMGPVQPLNWICLIKWVFFILTVHFMALYVMGLKCLAEFEFWQTLSWRICFCRCPFLFISSYFSSELFLLSNARILGLKSERLHLFPSSVEGSIRIWSFAKA